MPQTRRGDLETRHSFFFLRKRLVVKQQAQRKEVNMLKRIGCLVCGICLAFSSLAEMSETRRVTVNGIEWLYTINETDKDVKSIVLEKAILLTADQYDMTINVADFVYAVAPSYFYYDKDAWNEYLGCNWIVKIGASAFEGNEYLTKLTIEDGHWQEFTSNKIYITI